MPATIDMRLFWISGVLLLILLPFAPRIGRRAGDRRHGGRRNAILFIWACTIVVPILFYPLIRWNRSDSAFGQVFSWFCAHGMLAIMFSRMAVTMLSRVKEKSADKPAAGRAAGSD